MIFGSLLLILVAIVLAVLGVVQGSDPLLVGSIVASLLTAVFLAASARQTATLRLAAAEGAADVPPAPAEARGGDTAVIDEPAAGTGRPGTSSGTVDGSASSMPADSLDDGDAAGAVVPPEVVTDDEAPLDEAAFPAEQQPVATVVSIPTQYSPADRDDERLPAGAGGGRQPGARPAPDAPTQVELDLHPGPGPVDIPIDGPGSDDEPLDEPPAQLVPIADAALVAGLDTMVMVVDGRPRYHLVSCPHLVGKEAEAVPVNEAVDLGFTPCSRCEPDTTLLARARHA